jgi:tetratricopeptide (TPR) repeat protein
MNSEMKLFMLLTCIVGIFFLSGCTGSNQTTRPMRNTMQDRKLNEIKHDYALLHFIEGAALDAKGLYADAILEYQEALKAGPNAAVYFAISKDYTIRGNYETAAEQAHRAVLLDSNNILYRENLANIYFNASRTDLAIHEYEEIVRKDSTYVNGWFTLASLYQLTRPNKALEIYEKMLNRDNGEMDVLFQCAQIYISLGRYDEAATKFKQMLELDPGNKPLQKQIAETYVKCGRLDQAQTILEKMVTEDSSDTEVVTALADLYLNQKKFQNSIDLYENLLKRGIKNTEIKLRIGAGIFGLTEHDSTLIPKAQNLFEDIQKEIPHDWRPYWYLGAIAINQHKDSIAGNYFEKVTKLEERNADAWWFFASSLFEQGKYDSVLGVIEQPQKVFPNDFRFYLLQGLALTRIEKQENAVKPLEKAHNLNPKDLNALGTLALTLDGLRRYQDSDRLYEEGLKLDPKSALLLNNYSYSLAERGLQLQRALEMAKQAVTTEPDNAAYLDTFGWIFFKLEKYEDAHIYIEKSVSTGKASAVVYDHFGDVYQKLGQKEKALELWKKALEMDPKNDAVKAKTTQGAN